MEKKINEEFLKDINKPKTDAEKRRELWYEYQMMFVYILYPVFVSIITCIAFDNIVLP